MNTQTNILPEVELTPEERFNDVVNKVEELVGNPLSSWAVAATIESIGIRDIDALKDFNYPTVFDLAEDVYTSLKKRYSKIDQVEEKEDIKLGDFRESLTMFLKYYSAGLLFSLPMISQIVAIILFQYALWAWLYFNEAQASVIAFGTIAAFVLTGGFIQVIGRLVSKYEGEENYFLAYKAIKRVLKLAIPFVLVSVAFLIGLNIVLPFYPLKMVFLAMVYLILISFMLLSSAVLYASGQRVIILVSVLAGTAVVIFGMEVLNLGIYISQWIGIISSIIISTIYFIFYYQIKIRTLRQQLFKQSLPSGEVSYYNNYRYFIYGFCYFTFLFTDRLLAWSTGEIIPPYIIWFNTPYELGMDWALISLILTVAVLEFSIQLFSKRIIPAQKKAKLSAIKFFNRSFKRLYVFQIILLLVVSVISILVTYYGVLSLRVFEDQVPEIKDFFANPITFKVFWMASIGYVFLVYGLLNSLFFFTMKRPEFVFYSIIPALAINLLVGFVCSRVISFEYATVGLIVGSITYAMISGYLARRFFRHLDYYYYSAY
ncbi:MAG: hypothetical protein WC967_04155 [Balneolaceae bacterium]